MESQNLHLKRRLEQRLILRASRDFDLLPSYDRFVVGVVRAANVRRSKRLAEELACMRPLPTVRLAEYQEIEPVVSSQSLIRVNSGDNNNARSGEVFPRRLLGVDRCPVERESMPWKDEQ